MSLGIQDRDQVPDLYTVMFLSKFIGENCYFWPIFEDKDDIKVGDILEVVAEP